MKLCFRKVTERVSSVKRGFFEIAGFPNVIDCVDGSLIPIMKPTEHEHIYVSRKHCHAINLMVICDHNLLFTHVNARFPGSPHDSYVFRMSSVFVKFENNEVDGYLLGDNGYPMSGFLMTPFLTPHGPQRHYNAVHRKT